MNILCAGVATTSARPFVRLLTTGDKSFVKGVADFVGNGNLGVIGVHGTCRDENGARECLEVDISGMY